MQAMPTANCNITKERERERDRDRDREELIRDSTSPVTSCYVVLALTGTEIVSSRST
jgi:hypothetical protein